MMLIGWNLPTIIPFCIALFILIAYLEGQDMD